MEALTLTRPRDGQTPLQEIDGRFYKRDDLLAFSNGVNGKVRTSLYLAELARDNGATGLVYGGSVHAPALGRVASAAAYAGLDCQLVIGSDPAKAIRHETVRVAAEAGAELVRSSVAYNPVLQKRAAELAEQSGGLTWKVPYGVSTDERWDPAEVRAFLEVDADQVLDLIDSDVRHLVVPFGSANAASGILYGLATRGTGQLQTVHLMGIGPDRREWLKRQLDRAGVALDDLPVELDYMPLHPHFAVYSDRMPEHRDGIDFHPTYEGKVVRYLDTVTPAWWADRDGATCMWIVGGPLS